MGNKEATARIKIKLYEIESAVWQGEAPVSIHISDPEQKIAFDRRPVRGSDYTPHASAQLCHLDA
jgi:hypothetical protein